MAQGQYWERGDPHIAFGIMDGVRRCAVDFHLIAVGPFCDVEEEIKGMWDL